MSYSQVLDKEEIVEEPIIHVVVQTIKTCINSVLYITQSNTGHHGQQKGQYIGKPKQHGTISNDVWLYKV